MGGRTVEAASAREKHVTKIKCLEWKLPEQAKHLVKWLSGNCQKNYLTVRLATLFAALIYLSAIDRGGHMGMGMNQQFCMKWK